MPTPPALTTEQRHRAFERSLELRQKRAQIKRYLTSREWPLKEAFHDEAAQGMKVYDLLVSLPGIGDARARALLSTAKIPTHNTVRACGPKQRERLFDLLAK